MAAWEPYKGSECYRRYTMFSNKGMLMPRAAIHLSRVDAWPLAGRMHNDLVAITVSYHMYIIYIMYIVDITGSSFQLMEMTPTY